MVEDTGKKVRTETFRQINTPEPVSIEEDPGGRPKALKNGRRQSITAILDCWRIDDEWWRPETLSRLYYSIILETGQQMVVFKDLTTGYWFRQDY